MDEQEIREEAWREGAQAAYLHHSPGGTVFLVRPDNPYTPPVEYTPSLQEMNAVLLSKFSQREVWRGQKQREDQLAVNVRVVVAEELESFKKGLTHYAPAVLTVETCIRIIREMEG
jgi:hypothetical protein